MPQYIDSYYLIENRETSLIFNFICKYLPKYKESATDYPTPLFAEHPSRIFYNLNDIVKYLENNPHCEYAVYLENQSENDIIKHFMIFFTDDSQMIFGISINGKNPFNIKSVKLYHEISEFLDTSTGCITVEEAPPTNANEFIEFCKSRLNPKN